MRKKNYYALLKESFRMSNEHPRQWLYRRLISELFSIFSFGWGTLFLMEVVKPGLVSNYLSLQHLAVALLFLGIWALSLQQPEIKDTSSTLSKRERIILLVLSIILAFVLVIITEVSFPLTLLLILVTVGTLWAGTLVFSSDS